MSKCAALVSQSSILWAVLMSIAPGLVYAGANEDRTVQQSTLVLQQLESIPLQGIPAGLLQNAEGIAIFPDVVKIGFVLAGRHGHGVLLVRQPDGTWSNPVFLQLTGGGIGWQAGVQATDVVLVLKTPRSVAGILNGRRFTLGGDASVAAGPVGREASAATDLQLQAEIYSYSRSRGLFAGVSLQGTVISVDNMANMNFYNLPGILVSQILGNNQLAAPASATQLRNQVAQSARARTELVGGAPQTAVGQAPVLQSNAIPGTVPVPVNELQQR
jgi:lipid-binding SYLF domain-containing protein